MSTSGGFRLARAIILLLAVCMLCILACGGSQGLPTLWTTWTPPQADAAQPPTLPPSWTPEQGTSEVAAIPQAAAPTAVPSPTDTPPPTDTPLPTETPIPPTATQPPAPPVEAPEGMIFVPAGTFIMGSTDEDIARWNEEYRQLYGLEDWFRWEAPQHEVYLDAFFIDLTEVTNAQFAKFLNAIGNQEEGGSKWLSETHARIHQSDGKWKPDGGYADHPVVQVTWYGANAYCQWRGARLPTEAEWEKAARGADDARFRPWGNDDPTCDLANFDECVGDTRPVGSYPAGASPYGALDMVGNVWEWVADWYDQRYYANSPHDNPPGGDGKYKVLRGGSFEAGKHSVRVARRHSNDPANSYQGDGFRCAAD
jgi:formylglycine-generating enzyme required for sulfatase activity